MGKIQEGILGGFQGKVGTVVGGKWRGINYMRSKGAPNRTKFSEAQIIQQARFAFATRFIQPLQALYKIGYRSQIKQKTAINAAMSDIITESIVGQYPDFEIDYAYLRISKGSLRAANSAKVLLQSNQLIFTWDVGEKMPENIASNGVILAAIGSNVFASLSLLDFRRDAGTGAIHMPSGPSGSVVHCYIGFASASSPEVSNSIYAGAITLP
jgi:hypothetical protein